MPRNATTWPMIDVEASLVALPGRRPIFHSEADFQLALAWELQTTHPHAAIRLEYPIGADSKRMFADIWIRDAGSVTAIELKYKKAPLKTTVGGEQFKLDSQGAQVQGRFDFIKDICRLEQLSEVRGWALLLTNDPQYWGDGKGGQIDGDF